MKKIREDIDYGDYPERMDPSLERKLGSPESLYGKSPAMRRGPQDVERLATNRFKQVVDKLRQVTGIQDLSPNHLKSTLAREMMSKANAVMSKEQRHKDALEALAIKVGLDETETPEGWYKIEALLNRMPIDTSNFRYEPEEPEDDEEDENKPKKPQIPSFDVEELTDEEELELEVHKRNMINALIQGAAKKGHYSFQKPEIKAELDRIDRTLYPDYLAIMAINDFFYFTMEQMIEQMSSTGSGVAGKVELQDNDDDDEEGEEGEESSEDKPDTKIVAQGAFFPILCHEIIKGLEEASGRHGHSQNPEIRQKVRGISDVLSNEPMQLRIGPEIVEKIRFALPDEMYEESHKGLMPWFKIVFYKTPAKEFLEIIGNAISEDPSKVKKATKRFEEFIKEAKTMKEEFESYQEENDINPDKGDDENDGLDDFLSGLGISLS